MSCELLSLAIRAIRGSHKSHLRGVVCFRYTCSCPTDGSTVGSNCDTNSAASATGSDDGGASTAFAAVGAIGGLVLLAVAAVLYRIRHRRLQPIDMQAIQNEILSGLSLGGTVLNFGKDEIGLSLSFKEPLALAGALPVPMAAAHNGQHLLESLRSLTGLPNRLSGMLREQDATVTVDMINGVALLTMKRPPNASLKVGFEDKFAALLQRLAAVNKIHVKNRHFVHEVSVAVPQRVPQELDRRGILRLNVVVSLCSIYCDDVVVLTYLLI